MSLFEELKRRRVIRLIAAYVVVAWVLIQVVTAIEEPLNLPAWFDTAVIVLLGLGFPIAVIMSWIYDVTPEGVTREDGTTVASTGIDYGKIALGAVLLLGAFLAGNFITNTSPSLEPVSAGGENPPLRRFRFSISGPFDTEQLVSTSISISPAGDTVVYRVGSVGSGQLVSRSLDQLDFEIIEGAVNARATFAMSPDGRSIAFQDSVDGLFKTMPVSGGARMSVYDPGALVVDLAWSPSGHIVYGTTDHAGLFRIPESGGEAVELSNPAADLPYKHPAFIPESEIMMVSVGPRGLSPYGSDKLAFLLPDGELHVTDVEGSSPRVTSHGRLIYFNRNALWATTLGVATLSIGRNPLAIAENVDYGFQAVYSLSDEGSLVYRTARNRGETEVVLVDRTGAEEILPLPPSRYGDVSSAPDGSKFSVVRFSRYGPDLWLHSFDGNLSVQLTEEDSIERSPTWSPDGRFLYFSATLHDDLFRYDIDAMQGSERLTSTQTPRVPRSVSPDGTMVFLSVAGIGADRMEYAGEGLDLAAIDVSTASDVRYLRNAPSDDRFPTVSPDGKWLAYQSDRSGTTEIYVRPYPDLDYGFWQVSNGGGLNPDWNSDGTELFYWGETHLMSVLVNAGQDFEFGEPQPLFSHEPYMDSNYARYYVPQDRFILVKQPQSEQQSTNSFVLIQNWPTLLQADND